MYKIHIVLILTIAIGLFTSCKDEELDELMSEYCSCIDRYKMDPEGRLTCIDLMEELQSKYKGQPRKLNAIIEKAGECY